MTDDDRFRRLLDQQLEMNPRTWAAMQERGINERTLLLIEFSFTAPGKKAAHELVKVLKSRTNFSCEVLGEGSLLKRHWRVIGRTKPSTTSVEMLNDWVTFMVTLGAKHGECRFDGWGVRVPEPGAVPQSTPSDELRHSFGEQRRNGHHENTLLIDDESAADPD